MIDNGFDFFHPDLKGQITPGFYANGAYHTECLENIGHGTLTASVIAAKADNGLCMSGLAPNCRILTASIGTLEHELVLLRRKYSKSPKLFKEALMKQIDHINAFASQWNKHQVVSIANAIHYLVDHDVRVINCSIGGWEQWASLSNERVLLQKAFSYAEKKDVIIVMAAGNDARNIKHFPVSSKLVLIVGASLLNDTRWEKTHSVNGQTVKVGSNFGPILDMVAPSDKIQVCLPHDEHFYTVKNGPFGQIRHSFKGDCSTMPTGATSEAAPIVTSLIALCYSVAPSIEAITLIELIKNNCDDIGAPGVDIYTGHGRINFRKTLDSLLSLSSQIAKTTPPQ